MTETTNQLSHNEILALTSEIVASYVASNKIAVNELPAAIKLVFQSLTEIDSKRITAPTPNPAVPIDKSITNEYIVCLEDGKKLTMLKRYLRTKHNMTVPQYRERWNLPPDYPMVAPNYRLVRSKIAKSVGLGTYSGDRGKKRFSKKDNNIYLSFI